MGEVCDESVIQLGTGLESGYYSRQNEKCAGAAIGTVNVISMATEISPVIAMLISLNGPFGCKKRYFEWASKFHYYCCNLPGAF